VVLVAESVQSIERAFTLLRALATAPAGISELARRTGLAVSTTARLLSTLETIGAVERTASSAVQYRVGTLIGELSDAVDPAAGIVNRARPYLVELVAQIVETAGVSVAHGDTEVLYLDHVESNHAVQLRDWTGASLPLHVVSSGLVLLAHRSAAEIDRYIARGLHKFTRRTTVDGGELRLRLAEVRERGYVWTTEEFAEGISSVAAPVRANGRVVAAIHAHGPSYRFPGATQSDDIQRAVIAAAAAIST
jgi:DNA-binding IclR family transcriptional regulator